jgi:dihydrofolate synthase/folylpolyglutamate synthase
MLSAIFTRAGYPAGFYSSPHLVRFRERFRLRDRDISDAEVLGLINAVREVVEEAEPPTFFEFVTAMAFLHYHRAQADPVILETGMGGRLDATNIVRPLVSVITNIGRDHEDYLGRGLLTIAREKAGIIKSGAPLVTYATQKRVRALFARTCEEAGTRMLLGGRDFGARGYGRGRFGYAGPQWRLDELTTNLLGRHQYKNAAVALAALEILRGRGVKIPEAAVREGLQHVRWPGRLELLPGTPRICLDGAHNPAAAAVLAETLKRGLPHRRLILVLGIMADKEIDAILQRLLPLAQVAIFSRPEYSRAAPGAELAARAVGFGGESYVIEELPAAIEKARTLAGADDLVVITGSLFTVGEAREYLMGKEDDAGAQPDPKPYPVPH